LIVIAHLGPLPVEEMLPAGLIVLALGVPAIRARAKATFARARSRRDDGPI
jgi:hypothetical protein